ncbi:MAG TPA: hypothetical protein VFK23_10235, partial [Nitrospirota bacterium]|nr:hypothetical protein [Nitrospirota bacterium]
PNAECGFRNVEYRLEGFSSSASWFVIPAEAGIHFLSAMKATELRIVPGITEKYNLLPVKALS